MSSNDNSSTLGSYIDSAKGAAQSMLGSITGNQADKTEGDLHRTQAQNSKDASHAVGKVGPVAVSSSGGVSTDDPDRSEGSWNQTVGSGKEMLGNALGADGLKREGVEQNRQGKGQEAQGQLSDLGSGIGEYMFFFGGFLFWIGGGGWGVRRSGANGGCGWIGDRAKGSMGSAYAGLTGDRAKQEKYQAQHDMGKTQERSAEKDIQKQADH
ncbi:MAG: hypothetical protein M1830_002561 [Pleopsidium flavum]|nr:MAG: hypothetical protein M1830_002561 [Pleopsidium flavum]